MLRGIDVSSHKSDCDVNALAADFVIAKATGGNGYVDPSCDTFVQAAIASGKKWGVYHYFSDGFNDGDPIVEADYFVDNVQGYIGKGLLILDWERGGNPDVTNVGKALSWLQHVENRTGVKPLIYMSNSLVTELDWSPVVANGNGLWVAAYVDNYTVIPNYQMAITRDPNPNWDGNVNDVIWQFTSTGRIDGYGGNLDCNFFYGTREAWDAYSRITVAPTPPPLVPDPNTVQPAPQPVEVTPSEPTPTDTPTDPPTDPGSQSDTPTPTAPVQTPVPTEKQSTLWDWVSGLVGQIITFLTSWKRNK